VLLLLGGAVIGLVSGILALVLGHVIGAISVAFLDRFTLFDCNYSGGDPHKLGPSTLVEEPQGLFGGDPIFPAGGKIAADPGKHFCP